MVYSHGNLTRKNGDVCIHFFNLNDVIANTIGAMLADVMNHYGTRTPNCFLDQVWVKLIIFLLQSKMLHTTLGISPIFFHIYAALVISKNPG